VLARASFPYNSVDILLSGLIKPSDHISWLTAVYHTLKLEAGMVPVILNQVTWLIVREGFINAVCSLQRGTSD
jgi:hypothetical protein